MSGGCLGFSPSTVPGVLNVVCGEYLQKLDQSKMSLRGPVFF